jgi:hypothetical protein
MVLELTPLLVNVALLQISDTLHISLPGFWHLRLPTTSKTLPEKLWLQWLCCWHDARKFPHGYLSVLLGLPRG